MTRPKPKKPPKALLPHEDPEHPDYISPAEERRLRREFLRRAEYLFKVAEEKGYGPAVTWTKQEMRFKSPRKRSKCNTVSPNMRQSRIKA